MNDAGKTLEKVLTGLRVTEPPAGMHTRILTAMQTREGLPSTPSWSLRAAIAVCATVVAVLGIVTITGRRHAPVSVHETTRVVARQTLSPPPAPKHAARRKPAAHAQLVSYPAPPLPLTEQEKLLLRLAHGRDANNMAVLNPEVRAAETAKATTEFQQFFAIDAKEMRSQIE